MKMVSKTKKDCYTYYIKISKRVECDGLKKGKESNTIK